MEQPHFEKNPGGKAEALSKTILPWSERSKLSPETREHITTTTSQEVLTFFREEAVEYDNLSHMYDVLKGQPLFVRRESPERILAALENNESLHIGFPEGERYSNAVIWSAAQSTRGLENAYLEGYGEANGVVTVMGFKQEAVHDVVSLDDASQKFAGLDRTYVRSIRGEVRPEDILFVSVRVPLFSFPEKDMTPEEQERYEEYEESKKSGAKTAPQFIHRGFLFTKNLEKQ
ncbi:MAG TPA: hypothetical protein VIJ88_03385 [Candidatus Paceibacterota bacterium]